MLFLSSTITIEKKKQKKKPYSVKDGFKVLILKLHPFSKKRLNADTKVHLAPVQAFFLNWKVLLEKKYFCFTFSVKKNNNNNNKITTRCLSNFKGPIKSYLSAILSCEQRPFFLVTAINLIFTGISKLRRYCRHFEFGNVTWSRDDQSDICRR